MTPVFFHVHHVENKLLLPRTLTPGTAYFVDEDKCIIIDYGDGKGARVYGGDAWNAASTSGSAGDTGFLQEQIDTLSGGVLAFEKAYWDETEYIRRELAHKADITGEELRELRRLSGVNSEGLLNLAFTVNEEIGKDREQTAGLILQANANTAGILSLTGAVNEQAKTHADGTAQLVLQANANTEGILRLASVINEQADKTDDRIARLTIQANANTETLLRYAVEINSMWLRLQTSLTQLEAAISQIAAKQDIVIPDFPPAPPPPPQMKENLILAYYLMPDDTITVGEHTWTVTEITRGDGRITLTLDLVEGES